MQSMKVTILKNLKILNILKMKVTILKHLKILNVLKMKATILKNLPACRPFIKIFLIVLEDLKKS